MLAVGQFPVVSDSRFRACCYWRWGPMKTHDFFMFGPVTCSFSFSENVNSQNTRNDFKRAQSLSLKRFKSSNLIYLSYQLINFPATLCRASF